MEGEHASSIGSLLPLLHNSSLGFNYHTGDEVGSSNCSWHIFTEFGCLLAQWSQSGGSPSEYSYPLAHTVEHAHSIVNILWYF